MRRPMDSFRIDEIARRLLERVPPALRSMQQDLERDRKSTRLNSSHEWISYAVFCLKKKKKKTRKTSPSVSQRTGKTTHASPNHSRGYVTDIATFRMNCNLSRLNRLDVAQHDCAART